MSLLKPYTTSRNNAFPDTTTVAKCTQSWAWQFKQILINAAGISAFDAVWTDGLSHALPNTTVAGSSDGTTGAMDGVDRWTPGGFDATKLVMANEGSAHAWMVLKFTGICSIARAVPGNVVLPAAYLLINLDKGGTANDWLVSVYASWSGFTGGNASNRPTAADEVQPHISGSQTAVQQNGGGAVARHMHLSYAPDGSFFMVISSDGVGHGENAVFMIETIPAPSRAGTYTRPLAFGIHTPTTPNHPPWTIGDDGWNAPLSETYGAADNCIVGWNSSGSTKIGFAACSYHAGGVSSDILTAANGLAVADLEGGNNDLPMALFGMNSAGTQRTIVYPCDWAFAGWMPGTPGTPATNSIEPIAGQTEATLLGNTFWPVSGTLGM